MTLNEILALDSAQKIYTAGVDYTKERLDTEIKRQIEEYMRLTGTTMKAMSFASGSDATAFSTNYKRGVVRIAADHLLDIQMMVSPSSSLEQFLWGQEVPTILPALDRAILGQYEKAPAVARKHLMVQYEMRNPTLASALERLEWISSERGRRFPFEESSSPSRSLYNFYRGWQEADQPLYGGRIEQAAGAALAMKVPLAFILGLNYAESVLLIEAEDGTLQLLTDKQKDCLRKFCMLTAKEKAGLLASLYKLNGTL